MRTAPIITGPALTSGEENHRHHSKAFLHLSEKIIVKNGDSRMSYDMVEYDNEKILCISDNLEAAQHTYLHS